MSDLRPSKGHRVLLVAALLGLTAVGLGAFGAHGLKAQLEGDPDLILKLQWWETAAHYHLVHAGVLAAMGLAGLGGAAAGSMVVGILVFSGTLYAMTLGGPRWFGAITPIGGVALMLGWAQLALHAWRSRS